MSLASRPLLVPLGILLLWAISASHTAGGDSLRVCADPNNMPFSNSRGEGFENRIAELVARDLGRPLKYYWQPQRRGFLRTTLQAHLCDVVIGMASGMERVLTTRPYYQSSYVFVSRRDRHASIHSFDDPRLRAMVIGIQVVGEDYENPPPAQALASRQIVDHIKGFTVFGDYSDRAPQRAIVHAVAIGDVDIAVVWGPVAGYFAPKEEAGLVIEPVIAHPPKDPTPFAFDISAGVRRDDEVLRKSLDESLARRHQDVAAILREFGVPVVEAKRGSHAR